MQTFLLKLLEPRLNGPEAVKILTNLLHVNLSRSTIAKEVEEHPNYPSLLAISDVLNNYGVFNVGIRFDINKIASLPFPFITQLEGKKSDTLYFSVVKSVSNGLVSLYDPEKHTWKNISIAEFTERCSRVALLVEPEERAGETDYKIKRIEEIKKEVFSYIKVLAIPVIGLISISIGILNHGLTSLYPAIYTLLTIIGTGVSTLLLFYELDIHNPVLLQICSAGKKVNCGNILRSKGAKIFGISWSSIGFSYFMAQFLMLTFFGINNRPVLYLASWVNSLAASYVIFSIYYQWRVAKQWCVLCLIVQTILALQLSVAISGKWFNFSSLEIAIYELLVPAILSFIIPCLTVNILIPALQKAKEGKRKNYELQKLKHNREIFESLLTKQKCVDEIPNDLGISLGNKNGIHKLVKVCNPYCAPCARAHTPMERLLENNPDIGIQILFNASNEEGDPRTPPVKHLLAIAEKYDEAKVKEALDDWYLPESKDYSVFAKKHPIGNELGMQDNKITSMKEWCRNSKITYTPTFFIAVGSDTNIKYYQLPEAYNVGDLKYFFSK